MLNRSHVFRIALIGPESTGKTTLCEKLATHYNTIFNPEYSRNFVESLERKYSESDVIHCFEKQISLESELLKRANKILFADTEAIMSKIWLTDVFKSSSSLIEQNIREHSYDLYLLTSPDLAFEKDPVRENPHRREFFFNQYENELRSRNLNYQIIEGVGLERMENAIKAIDLQFKIN